jgi:predicted RNA-binding Zn-ribbon protein involved in translation (DUF1610 family)
MTRANALGRAETLAGESTETTRRKSLLVCPNCGHESPTEGDWIVTLHETTVDLSCPDCRRRLTTRWLTE